MRNSEVPTDSDSELFLELNTEIQRIVGSRLDSISFVLDYLIVGFGPHGALTLLVWPEIDRDEKILTFGSEGYRDSLCSLIEHNVESAAVNSEEIMTITFENGVHLRIRLTQKAFGERAILTGTGQSLTVF